MEHWRKSQPVFINSRKADLCFFCRWHPHKKHFKCHNNIFGPSLYLYLCVVMSWTSVWQPLSFYFLPFSSNVSPHFITITFLLRPSFSCSLNPCHTHTHTCTDTHIFESWFRSRAVIQVILTSQRNDIGVQFQCCHERARDTQGFQLDAQYSRERPLSCER